MSKRLLSALVAILAAAGASPAASSGDATRGRMLYESRCIACHSIDANRTGPAHARLYGRKAGSAPGYGYSDALRKSAIVWDEKALDLWLADPERLIPGQRMGYSVQDAAERADLIAYLRRVSE